jgi:hypothetical protein
MNLSFKDTKFIVEALTLLIQTYNERLEDIEDLEEREDEASDLSNDVMFLEILVATIEQNLKRDNTLEIPNSSIKTIPPSVDQGNSQKSLATWYENYLQIILSFAQLRKLVLQRSLDERLSMIEEITRSIRQENTGNFSNPNFISHRLPINPNYPNPPKSGLPL